MEHQQINIKVIVGSTREGRFSPNAAAWIAAELKQRSEVHVEILDLKDYELPFFNEAISPSMKSAPYQHEAVARLTAKVNEGDGYVIVTPEYNHGPSGVLKNALDWIYQEWNQKPVAFVSYGSVGGARAVEQLRSIAIELQMAPIREAIHINGEQYFPAYFGKTDVTEMFNSYQAKTDSMIEQLLWWARALKSARG